VISMPKYGGMINRRTLPEIAGYVKYLSAAGYDPAAIGAVIEIESAKSWDPSIAGPSVFSEAPGYPVGLIQFAPSTARKLGTSSAQLQRMTFAQQVPFVAKYYDLFGGPAKFTRPVDYYLAGWGDGVGSADSYVLARRGDGKFEANQALARGDDTITTGDLRAFVERAMAAGRSNGVLLVDVNRPTQFAAAGVWPEPAPGLGGSLVAAAILVHYLLGRLGYGG